MPVVIIQTGGAEMAHWGMESAIKQKIEAKAPRISKIWIDKRFGMVYNDFPYCVNMPQ